MSKGKIAGLSVVAVLALVVALPLLFGWLNASRDIVSASNVKRQHTAIIQDWESMVSAAENACSVVKAGVDSNPNDATLVESPVLAYEATFRRIRASYERKMQNLFEAQLVAPSGYPTRVPHNEDWCQLAEEMNAIQ